MKPPFITILNYAGGGPSGGAHLPFTCNASRVTETATNFLHQVDLSKALNDATFKASVTDRSSLVIRDDEGNPLPSKMLLNLSGNTLLAYFDGPKSTSADTTFHLYASPEFTEVDSTAAFTNCGITNFWGFDEASGTTAYDYAGSANINLTSSISLGNTGHFGGSALADSTYSYGSSSSNLNYGSAQTMVIGVTLKRLSPLGQEKITFRYGDIASIACLEIRFRDSNDIRVYTQYNYYQQSALGGYGVDGNYHCYALAYNGNLSNNDKVKIYYDGELQSSSASNTISSTMPSQAYPMWLGHNSGGGQPCNYENLYVKNTATDGFLKDRYRALFESSTFYTIGEVG